MLSTLRLGAATALSSPGILGMAGMAASRLLTTLTASKLVLDRHGHPAEVLSLKTEQLSDQQLGDQEMIIKMLAAPINPSDINTIEGVYPLKPALPGIPGHEGVGVVTTVGSKVTRMRVGDRVVPIEHSQGTWRTAGVFHQKHWYKVPKDLPVASVAAMVINPPTALRLLEEFEELKAGDTVVQTGATSAVGKYVIQLAHHRGVHTINIVRDRATRPEVEADLKDLGATVVCTAEELPAALEASGLDRPKLALDCVCGPASTAMARSLATGGTLVVYGAMSKEPLIVPPGLLIFKDIRVRGFWLTGGFAKMSGGSGLVAKEQLADRVCALFRQGILRPVPVESVPIERWQEALAKVASPKRDKKILLTFDEDVC